ncbi:hypothetical protein EUTSA_v10014990mg [Eutrema salsugineum]|uniref:Uncharacterized protein n=1 Tax=Eutrema salsugineum TaxID=72664 RepID=V4L920_EUTSA|nr:uncharacterized protein LOC18019422 [Eutrema salsugineum]ESQ40134.1 hypothetical protein EUTSA_v10014990mg [Eutrema salsugineum]
MAIAPALQTTFVSSTNFLKQSRPSSSSSSWGSSPSNVILPRNKRSSSSSSVVVAAVGDVSSDGTIYLIAGAAAVALVGTAFPILFKRTDTCPECDGAGFVRKQGATLRANAARKDQAQIVCSNCNGLGKLNQIDK